MRGQTPPNPRPPHKVRGLSTLSAFWQCRRYPCDGTQRMVSALRRGVYSAALLVR